MKRKIIAAVALVGIVGASIIGCGSKEISNEYITISQYKGLEVEEVKAKVSDEDVTARIEEALQANGNTEEITDRAVQNGDIATIDFVGTKDGEEFQGGNSTDWPLKIGSGNFIEGFEEGVVGHNVGDNFDLNLTFPETYGVADLAGQEVVFNVTVKKIEVENLPELNDKFVTEVSEKSKTVEEYKKEVKADLLSEAKIEANYAMSQELWIELMDKTEVKKYPKDQLADMKEEVSARTEEGAKQAGIELEQFIGDTYGMSLEDYEKEITKVAKESLKQQLIIELIAKKEKLTFTEKEYEEKYKEYTKLYGYTSVDELKGVATEEVLQQIVKKEAVDTFLVDNSKKVAPEKDSKE